MSESVILHWLSRSGAQVHPSVRVSSASATEQHVINTTAPIPAGSTLLEIPGASVLTVASSALAQRIPALSNIPEWPALILSIMYESSIPNSKWKTYLASLPREFDSLMYWSEDDLKELKGSAVLDKIGKEEAEGMYHTDIHEFIEEHQDVFQDVDTSLETFHRTGSWIMAFSSDFEKPNSHQGEDHEMDEDDDEDEELNTYKAMIPFANLIPGDCELANCEFKPSVDKISLMTTKDIDSNSLLYTDPGPLPRSDLLRRLGNFPASSSQYDVAEIDSTLIISVAGKALNNGTRDIRIQYLVEDDALEDSYDIEASGAVPSEILTVIQAFSVDNQTFHTYVTDEKFPKAKKDSKSRDILLEVIEKRLALYDTTVEDDVAVLRSGVELSRRKRMALEVRLGEKQILRRMEEVVSGWGDEQNEGGSGRERKRQKLQ